MQTVPPSDTDHFWRWHDRMGIPRPGKEAPNAASALNEPWQRARKAKVGITGGKVVTVPRTAPLPASQRLLYTQPVANPEPTPTRLVELYTRRARAREELMAAERQRDRDWQEYVAGRLATFAHPKTITRWRKANVRLAKIEHVEIPLALAVPANPSWVAPPSLRRPKDYWRCRLP